MLIEIKSRDINKSWSTRILHYAIFTTFSLANLILLDYFVSYGITVLCRQEPPRYAWWDLCKHHEWNLRLRMFLVTVTWLLNTLEHFMILYVPTVVSIKITSYPSLYCKIQALILLGFSKSLLSVMDRVTTVTRTDQDESYWLSSLSFAARKAKR